MTAGLYREVTNHVQYVSPANSIASNHGNDWLWQPPYLDLHAFGICQCMRVRTEQHRRASGVQGW